VVFVDHGAPAVDDGVADVGPSGVGPSIEGLCYARGVIHELYDERDMFHDPCFPVPEEFFHVVSAEGRHQRGTVPGQYIDVPHWYLLSLIKGSVSQLVRLRTARNVSLDLARLLPSPGARKHPGVSGASRLCSMTHDGHGWQKKKKAVLLPFFCKPVTLVMGH
jgi:hypothetical protein